MFFKCLMFLVLSTFIEAQFPYTHRTQLCPYPHLDHGRVRVRQRSRMVKFMCSLRYELVGNRYATCRNGQWDVPMPVCVKPGCPELPSPANSVQNKVHHNAWVQTYCLNGYKLIGSPAMYCNGYRWNSTNPTCVATTAEPSLSCDFEDSYICGWTQDELHDFDWKRWNRKTPSSFMNTGPSYDHTLGVGNNGFYMYIESTTSKLNETARLISPVYDSKLAASGCFSFFYHMYGRATGGLRIYQKPDSLQLGDMLNMTEVDKAQYILFEQWGNLGDIWFSAAPQLKQLNESFQIVIEGIRGSSVTSDIAIDDVAILQGANCSNFRIAATSPAPIFSETCTGRCHNSRKLDTVSVYCGCTLSCLTDDSCCSDFMDVCVFDNSNNPASDPDDPSPSDSPQTEKLVGETTTTSTELQTSTTEPPTTLTTTLRSTTTSTTPKTTTTLKTTTTTLKTTTVPTTKSTTRTTRLRVTTSTTAIPKTVKTTTRLTTKPTTTKVLTTPKRLTTKNIISTTTKTTILTNIEKQKSEKELNVQKMSTYKPISERSSTWKTAVITIVVLALFASLIYLGVAARTVRGRVALARLRGRLSSTHDSEVRYLNSNDDDDL